MAVTATPVFVQTPRLWTACINNADASNWKVLYDGPASTAGGSANGTKIASIVATSTDSTARNVVLAVARKGSVTCTSASPGVFTWTGHNLSIGDQVFLGGTTVPSGFTASVPYFVVAGGYVAGSAFELSATIGGSAVNTASTGTSVVAYSVRPITTIPVAITAGTDGSTAAAYFFNTTYSPGIPVDNDGQPYIFMSDASDYLAISCTGTVTSAKIICVNAIGANF